MSKEEKSLYDLMDDLRANYANLTWYGKLTFPSKIATLIEKYEDNSDAFLTQFILAFSQEVYTAQKQLYPLWPFYHSVYNTLTETLSEAGLLSGENAESNCQSIIAATDPDMRVLILSALERMNILNQETFERAMSHTDPNYFQRSVMSLEWLHRPDALEMLAIEKTYGDDDREALNPEVLNARRDYEFMPNVAKVIDLDVASEQAFYNL